MAEDGCDQSNAGKTWMYCATRECTVPQTWVYCAKEVYCATNMGVLCHKGVIGVLRARCPIAHPRQIPTMSEWVSGTVSHLYGAFCSRKKARSTYRLGRGPCTIRNEKKQLKGSGWDAATMPTMPISVEKKRMGSSRCEKKRMGSSRWEPRRCRPCPRQGPSWVAMPGRVFWSERPGIWSSFVHSFPNSVCNWSRLKRCWTCFFSCFWVFPWLVHL